jgi:hypothetical protein
VIDRFNRLRHDGVVGRDHKNGDVGGLGTTGTHRGKGGVTGRVDEGDQLTVLLDLVGTDVLGDAAGFTRDHIGATDGIEQRGLAVVDVAHDGDHRRPRYHLAALVLDIEDAQFDVGFRDAADGVTEFTGNQLGQIGVDDVARLHHLAFLHQVLDHVDRAFGHTLREFLDGDGFRQGDFAGNLLARLLRHRAAHLFLTAAHRRQRAATRIAVIVESSGQRQLAAAAIFFCLRTGRLGRFGTRDLGAGPCRATGTGSATRAGGSFLFRGIATAAARGLLGGRRNSLCRRVGGSFLGDNRLLSGFLGQPCILFRLDAGGFSFFGCATRFFLGAAGGLFLCTLAFLDIADAAVLKGATARFDFACGKLIENSASRRRAWQPVRAKEQPALTPRLPQA